MNSKSTQLSFSKMQGAGNDFMVIDAIHQTVHLSPQQIQQLANRQFGVGFDQLLLVESSSVADFKYRIFNADGSEVAQCGNGARCFVRFVAEQGLSHKKTISVETASGIIHPSLEDNGLVTVNMGAPKWAPSDIPFIADAQAAQYALQVGEQTLQIAAVSMGNPHAVLQVNNVETAAVVELGQQIEVHPRFPKRVNVGFMQIVNPQQIKLRVFERGAGETLACGTGACAAVVAGIRMGLLNPQVDVQTHGGVLSIEWQGVALNDVSQPVWMTGPATSVFEGEIDVPELP